MTTDVTTDVLVAGAGPTGLVMALWLHAQGVRVRIIDKAKEPAAESRALAVQARTLELYRQLALDREVVARGRKVTAVNMWRGRRKKGMIAIGDIGKGISPFPFVIIYPQDEHERFLIEELRARGVEVERQKELTSLEASGDTITAHAGGERIVARYVAGCDGARSKVRDAIGATFPGGTYDHLFYVADVEAHGPVVDGSGLHVMFEEDGFLAIFPLAGAGRIRLIGTIADDEGRSREYTWSDIDRRALELIRLDVTKVNWFSTYRVHHRVAEPFRKGRIFLLGDAAHIHSPVGGQGMNTGIGDAINLAWKLACVLQGRGRPELLDTYEVERAAFAHQLVATTDRLFTGATSTTRLARAVREHVLPRVFGAVSKLRVGRRLLFERVSQTQIEYPDAERLPWVEGANNYEPLAAIDWQLHAYGGASLSPELVHVANERDVAIHTFEKGKGTYLVRPDGYAVKTTDIAAYLREHAIRGRSSFRARS